MVALTANGRWQLGKGSLYRIGLGMDVVGAEASKRCTILWI
jgi:hypothetical protein